MRLPDQMFADIVASLDAAAASNHPDHRRAQRVQPPQRMAVVTLDGGRGRSSQLRIQDLSPRGIGLLRQVPLQRGQQIVVHLPRSNGSAAPILCTVVYARPVGDEPHAQYHIGAEFQCAVEPDALSQDEANKAEIERIRRAILA